MSATRRQKRREKFATWLVETFGQNESSQQLRATNRRVEKRKRVQLRKQRGGDVR